MTLVREKCFPKALPITEHVHSPSSMSRIRVKCFPKAFSITAHTHNSSSMSHIKDKCFSKTFHEPHMYIVPQVLVV